MANLQYPRHYDRLAADSEILITAVTQAFARVNQALSALSRRSVQLSLVSLLNHDDTQLEEFFGDQDVKWAQVFQALVSPALPGSAGISWLLPEVQAVRMMRLILQQGEQVGDLSELEQEALIEIGNIIINTCLVEISRQLPVPDAQQLPELNRTPRPRLFGSEQPIGDDAMESVFSMDITLGKDVVPALLVIDGLDGRTPTSLGIK